jgi:rubrerythrin
MDEEVLLKAIHSEIQSRNAYELLAGRIKHESGRLVMDAMSREEEGHRRTLAAWYRKLTGRDYAFDTNIEVGPDLSFIKKSTFAYTDGLEALRLALGAEIDAIAFYTEALQTAGKNDKKTLKSLIKFENRHKKILTKEIEKMETSNHWDLPKA